MRKLEAAAVVGAATLLAYPLYGYAVGMHNHAIQIPLLRHLQDPSLFPGDRFVATLDNYASFFWPAMAWVTRFVPYTSAFAVGHFITEAALLAAVLALAVSLFPAERWAPYAAVWSVLWANPYIGGERMHWSYFTHTQVASAASLWTVVLAVRGAWTPAFLLAGLIFNIHMMASVYVGVMVGAAALYEPGGRWARLARGGGVAALAASPGLWWLMTGGPLASPPDLDALLRAYFPQHFFLSAIAVADWRMLAGVTFVLAVTYAAVERTPRMKRIVSMIVGGAALVVIVGVGTESAVAPATLLKLHVLRALPLLIALTLVLASGHLASIASGATGIRSTLALVALVLASPLVFVLDDIVYDSTLHRVGAGIAFVSGVVGVLLMATTRPRLGIGVAACGAALLTAILQYGVYTAREENSARRAEWVRVQEWAKANTPLDSRFFTPPSLHGFRIFSERSVAAEWLDGSALMFDTTYVDYWRTWYLDVGGEFLPDYDRRIWDRLRESFERRPLDEVESLARKYGADYVVLRRSSGGPIPTERVVFTSAEYFVVAIAPP